MMQLRMRLVLLTSWQVLLDALQRFSSLRATEAAASMAFYATFAFFPFVLFTVAMASFVLDQAEARSRVLALASQWVPMFQELAAANIDQVLRARGATSTVAALGLLWSASGFFSTLARQINRVWPNARARTLVQRRLLAVSIVVSTGLLATGGYVLNRALRLILAVESPLQAVFGYYASSVDSVLSAVLPWVIPFVVLVVLYGLLPNTRVSLMAALIGAAVATLLWRGTTAGFVYYVGVGLTRYRVVYGSLSSAIALIFWVYLSNVILLFGAHLTEAISPPSRWGR